MINEDFLYYIWRHRLLTETNFKCATGESISIIDPGNRNSESGPDFSNARIKIDGVTWAGNVEIHVKSSDWFRHLHERDPNYNNVILHVVYVADTEIRRKDGSLIPTLEVRGNFPSHYLEHYSRFIKNGHPVIPCYNQTKYIPDIVRHSWIDRITIERLEKKFDLFSEIFESQNKNWPAAFYLLMARTFGFKVNSGPFEILARSTPYSLLMRNNSTIENTEALLFGQSGLLTHAKEDPYILRLKNKYQFFKSKSGIEPISPHLWKFGGLRPYNFPTLRIAQFAGLFAQNDHLIDRILSTISLEDVIFLLDVSASDYWYLHYRFGQESAPAIKKLGQDAIRNIIINAVVPFLFFYGKKQHQPIISEKAIFWLEKILPENNRIIRIWQNAGWQVKHAGESQALIHLKQNYCDEKRCIACSVGQFLIKPAEEYSGN